MPPSSWTMLSDSEASHDDETQTNDNNVNQHHSPFHFISSQIQEIISQISDALHQVQQRKGQQLIIGYSYNMNCDIHPNNDNSNSNAGSDSSPAWNIVTTPKTSSVDRVLENWKYQGQALQDDGLFLSYIDLTLDTFEDLERVTNLLVEIGAKYVDNMRENHRTAASFDILFDNMGKIQVALQELCVATTDAVDNIGEDNDVKENMDQLMECYKNVCEKLPVSLKMEGKCDVAGTGVSLDILGDNDEDEKEEKEVLDIGDYSNLELDETRNYHSNEVNDLKAYSIDGIDYIASCSEDQRVKILRLEDRSVVATLTGHTDWVYSLQLYKKRDGTQCLASCGGDGRIKLWNLHTNTLINTLRNSKNSKAWPLAHYVENDKPYLACGYENGDIVVWDLESHNVVATLKGRSGYVCALDVMEKNNKQYLVSAGSNEKIRVWDLETYELVKAINNAHDCYIQSLASFVYDDKVCIASGDDNGKIKIWDSENYTLMSTLEGHTSYVLDIKVCQSGGVSMLASAGNDASIKFWRLDDMSLSHVLTSTYGVYSLEFVKDGDDKTMMISGCSNGNFSFWKLEEN